jgi:hypothetical protein
MRTAAGVCAAIGDLWHYHPACLILALMFVYHAIRWLFLNTAKKRFTPERCTNIMITGGAMGLGKLLAE